MPQTKVLKKKLELISLEMDTVEGADTCQGGFGGSPIC